MDGNVTDFFGGIADLRAGRVRFVGDPEKRIHEDILRILRFFRFYAHFGRGAPDAAALAACAKNAGLLPRLSAERVRHEILRLLESDNCAAVWKLMRDARIVTQVLPEATDIPALEKLVALEEKLHSPAFPLRRLAALLVVTPAGLMQVAQSLRLSSDQSARLLRMMTPADTSMDEKAVRALVYREGNDMARNLLLLGAAKGADNNLALLYGEATSFRPPRFPVTGEDALGAGLKTGPDIGRVLKSVEDWWIAEDFRPGRTACLERLRAR
jgi:poly(A) polymerase